MHTPLRIGIVGAGDTARRYAEQLAGREDVSLVGVYDVVPAQARRIAEATSSRVFERPEALFAAVDAAFIATDVARRASFIARALDAEVHVLSAAPMGASLREATFTTRRSDRSRRTFMVAQEERFNPAVTTLKQEIGDTPIVSLHISRVEPGSADFGLKSDLTVCDGDLVCFLTGQSVEDVYKVPWADAEFEEDTQSVHLRVAGGIGAQITTRMGTALRAHDVQVVLKDRILKADLIGRTVQEVRHREHNPFQPDISDLPIYGLDPVTAVIDAFIRSVQTGAEPPVTARDALRAANIAFRATSARQKTFRKAA